MTGVQASQGMFTLSRKTVFDWKAWLCWIGSTLAAIELCVLSLYYPVRYAPDHLWEIVISASLAVAGSVLGTAQWFWLRKRSVVGPWWIVATVGGWFLALGVDFLVFVVFKLIAGSEERASTFLDSSWLVQVFMFLIPSTLVSLPQFFVLRLHVPSSGWWIAVRPLSWFAGCTLCDLAYKWGVISGGFIEPDQIFRSNVPEILGWSVFFLFFGLGFAAINGAAMVLLLRPVSYGTAH